MVRIFISYRRRDVPDHVERLTTHLEDAFGKASVFTDVRDIGLGEDFLASIKGSLAEADVILVVIGPKWLGLLKERLATSKETEYTSAEVAMAMKHEMNVVPVLVGGAKMPTPRQLPPAIRDLSLRNGIALGDATWKRDVAGLVAYLKTAEWRVSEARGYLPRQLVFTSMRTGLVAWVVAGSIAYAVARAADEAGVGRYRFALVTFVAAGLASGALVGVAHWLFLRKSKIVIKRSVWRGLVRTWAGLSVLAGGLALKLHLDGTLEGLPEGQKVGVFVGVPVAIGAFIGWMELRKLRRVDPNIRRRAALALLLIWAIGNVVGLTAGGVAHKKYEDAPWLHWDDVLIPDNRVWQAMTVDEAEAWIRDHGLDLTEIRFPKDATDASRFRVIGVNQGGWVRPGTEIVLSLRVDRS